MQGFKSNDPAIVSKRNMEGVDPQSFCPMFTQSGDHFAVQPRYRIVCDCDPFRVPRCYPKVEPVQFCFGMAAGTGTMDNDQS
jgi:hypothetical protein